MINPRIAFLLITIIGCLLYIITHYSPFQSPILQVYQANNQPSKLVSELNHGWITSSLYKELQSYITSRDKILRQIKKPIRFDNGNMTTAPLNYDYIQFIKNPVSINYPYSKWECSNTSNTDYKNAGEYCILSNIYYNSTSDEYYFYQDPSQIGKTKERTTFMAPHHEAKITIVSDSTVFQKNFNLAAILTQPVLVASPPDLNYAHGFLETCGPRFWTLAECQYHASYIDPSKIQIYLSSALLETNTANWAFYKPRSDGTYEVTRHWERMIQSMLSIYPLITYKSFNQTNVMFKYMIYPGHKMSRSASWGYTYLHRKYQSYPMPTQHYRRAYLAYSEWILNHLQLPSKFELTTSQKELQLRKTSESIPICNQACVNGQGSKMSTDGYTGEWIVVLNRAGSGRREITNADDLIQSLLNTFPDHSNPYLRVWPKQLNFGDDLYQTARMARSIRVLIGVHGAGLSNAIFMRPGAILLEINPYGCRDLSFNFRRWAEVFNLQHALWIPSYGDGERQDDVCQREGTITLNTKEIIDEVMNVLKNEMEYRSGYIKRALTIMTDLSIVDYPPKGYEKVLS